MFVYDPTAGIPAIIEEVHDESAIYYVREPNGALVCRIDGEATQYYHFDELGSTLFLTGSAGTVTDEYSYDAWGNVISHEGTSQQPYQYVGQLGYFTHYQDANMSGLLQLGVRFYDPMVGRFTQRDPVIEIVDSVYSYAGNAPISNVDADGRAYYRIWRTQRFIKVGECTKWKAVLGVKTQNSLPVGPGVEVYSDAVPQVKCALVWYRLCELIYEVKRYKVKIAEPGDMHTPVSAPLGTPGAEISRELIAEYNDAVSHIIQIVIRLFRPSDSYPKPKRKADSKPYGFWE